MANNDNLKVEVQAELNKTQSRTNITNDIKKLENTPFAIRLIAKLHQALSKTNINSDIKKIEQSAPTIRLNGRLNRATTRRNIRNDADSLANSANVTLGAQIDRNELQQSVNTARNDIEQNLHNNPINVPMNVNVNGNADNGVQQVQNLNNQVRNARGILEEYFTARDVFRAVTNSIKKTVDEVEELNKAETDLRIATSKSATEIKSLMQDYNQLAKDMSSTTLDVTGAADDWLRQGQSVADTNTLIQDSLILSKIGQIESGQATEYLTSAMKGYQTEVNDVINIVDKLSAVDLESASNSGELAEAMSKVSNVARSAGVEIDTLIAYLATAKDITQDDASVIGNSFRSIFTRLNNIKIGKFLDEDGNDISGEINDAERVLSKFNISLRDNAKEFRDAQDIIADVANAWETMSSVEQAAIRKAFANTYQAEKFTAIMTNYNKVLQLTEVSQNSAGTAMEKFSIYENSLEAATNRLTASLEGLAYNTIDGDFLKGLANATAGIVEFVDSTKLLKTGLTAGIFTGAIAGLVALGTRMVAVRNNVTLFTQAMNISRSTTALTANQYNNLRTLVNGLSEAQLRLVLSSRQLTEAQRLQLMQDAGIEQARQRQLLQTWNLTNATNAQTGATFSLRGAWEGLKASIATNPIGLVVTALTLATTAITTYKQKQEEARQAAIDSANKYEEQAQALEDLRQKYIDILDSDKSTIEKTEELNEWKKTLVETYGDELQALQDVNLEREKGLGLLDAEIAANNRKSRNTYLEENKKNIQKSYAELGKSSTDAWYSQIVDEADGISERITKLFDDVSTQELEYGIQDVNLSLDYDDEYDRLDKLKNLYNEFVELERDRPLTDSESRLFQWVKNEKKAAEDAIANLGTYYETASKYNAQNLIEDYIKTDEGKLENVGKDTFLSWQNGLLLQAKNAGERNEILKYIEEQFPDYTKYFNNLEEAKKKFSAYEGTNKFNFLKSLSEEDLEAALNIPDLFADGLDGATAKIEAWKSDPNNKITTDVEVDDADLSKMLETTSKKVKLITTAMEEMNDTGSISSSTYGEIVEMGGNFTDCLEVQNGKLKLNVQKLKDLEKQENLNAIAANRLAIAELQVSAARAGQIGDTDAVESIRKQISALDKENALYYQIIDEITNAEPDEKKKSSDPWKEQFDKEYSKKQHLLAMEQLSEEEYLDWLDDAYKKYFSDLTKYQDEYYKYEEEVYKGRKQLAEDYFDEEQKLFEDRVSNLETQIEITTKTSESSDGTKLNTKEKYDYIRSAYQEILNEIEGRINEIVQAGVDGHEDLLAELEQQLDEYKEKLSDVFKDAVEEEQDYIEKQKDAYSDLYDERIDKIKEQQDAAEKAAQAEIDAIQEKIDALKEANEKAEEANDIEEARQALEKASQKQRAVFGSDGSMTYQVDQEKVKEAQEELDRLLLEQQISILEDQKEALESAKDKQSEAYDTIIDNLETEKENGEKRFDILLQVLDEYLNPDNTTSNTDVWSKLAKMEGAKYEDGVWSDKDGNVIDIDKLLETAETKTEDEKKSATDNSKANTKDNGAVTGTMERMTFGSEKSDIEDEVKGKTESAIDGFFAAMEKRFNLEAGSLTLEKMQQAFGNSPMMNFNPYGAMKDRTGLANKEYVSNVNNNNKAANVTVGDIHIHNPVGDSNDLAKELQANLHNAADKIIYSNLK